MKEKKVIFLYLVLWVLYATFSYGKVTFEGPKVFKGVVKPLASNIAVNITFDDEYKGYIKYVPMVGALFKGPIYDSKGRIIKKGTVLVKMSTEFRDAQVTQALAAVKQSEAALEAAKKLYERYKKHKLYKEGAISHQTFINAKSAYLEALAQLEANKAALIAAKKKREACTYYAPFDGIVESVVKPAGWGGDFGTPVITITQLSPIGINVKMTRELATYLNTKIPVLIYPISRPDLPVEPFLGKTRLTKDGLQFIVRNFIIAPKYKEINGKRYKVINNLESVIPFSLYEVYHPGDPLAIPQKAIMKDENGYYVFKDAYYDSQKVGQGINPIVKLEKVYIVPGNKVKKLQPNHNYIILKDNGGLLVNDKLLLAKDAKGLREGDVVYYQRPRYLFMPGDPVKVVIGGKAIPR